MQQKRLGEGAGQVHTVGSPALRGSAEHSQQLHTQSVQRQPNHVEVVTTHTADNGSPKTLDAIAVSPPVKEADTQKQVANRCRTNLPITHVGV